VAVDNNAVTVTTTATRLDTADDTGDKQAGEGGPGGGELVGSDVRPRSERCRLRDHGVEHGDRACARPGRLMAGTMMQLAVQGIVVNGANAGNLQFQWAQGAVDAGVATTVFTSSWLLARRVA
jgi:hypothetical protein